ncbi:MAG TPA: hypothetical protein VFR62_02390, partial [Gemmatimonadales bacterium]|nr:hypothetical protein [Gemmatimonadales bacterium]
VRVSLFAAAMAMAGGAYSSAGADWAGAVRGRRRRRNSALSGEKTVRMKELDVENGSHFNLWNASQDKLQRGFAQSGFARTLPNLLALPHH